MLKKEFVRNVSAKTGFAQKDVTVVLDAVFDEIKNVIADGSDISIQGFAKFYGNTVKGGDKKVNSLTGETYVTKSRIQPKVKFSPVFRDSLVQN